MIDIAIHDLNVEDFFRLKNNLEHLTEWTEEENSKNEPSFYLSARLVIGDFRLTLFSKDYKNSLKDRIAYNPYGGEAH